MTNTNNTQDKLTLDEILSQGASKKAKRLKLIISVIAGSFALLFVLALFGGGGGSTPQSPRAVALSSTRRLPAPPKAKAEAKKQAKATPAADTLPTTPSPTSPSPPPPTPKPVAPRATPSPAPSALPVAVADAPTGSSYELPPSSLDASIFMSLQESGSSGVPMGQTAPVGLTDARSSSPDTNRSFLTSARDTVNYDIIGAPTIPPISDTILSAGSIIPIVIISGINSDLPGTIIAQVQKDVRDSLQYRDLLIPAGSKLIGDYNTDVIFGQSRIMIVWSRLIRPDGSSLLLNESASDISGYSGVRGKRDDHWGAVFGALAVATLINIGNMEATQQLSELEQFSRSISAGLGGTLDTTKQMADKVIDRALDIPPTVIIKPGAASIVITTKDLVIPPYKGAR